MNDSELTKIRSPVLDNTSLRPRLFHRLDQLCQKPLVWIEAAAGYGKTTLVASYLREKKIAPLWYQVDEGDNDIASFFYYLSMAAQQRETPLKNTSPLPLLTPEYMAGLPVFTRNFFRELYGQIGSPGVLVFDNYQLLDADAPLHQVLATALSEIPPGITIIVISREAPPTQWARLQANQQLALLGTDELTFNREETAALMLFLGHSEKRVEEAARLQKHFGGWCAGMVLQLLYEKSNPTLAEDTLLTPNVVFDYLAVEVFDHMSKKQQEVLLACAFLPQISVENAHRLTGVVNSGEILKQLSDQHCFTSCYSQKPPIYQLHPLFREFLLRMGQQRFTQEYRQTLQRTAAKMLLAQGQLEAAAELFNRIGAFKELRDGILEHAPQLIEQGRWHPLQLLIQKLPEPMRTEPDICYWLAVATLPTDFEMAYKCYEQAMSGFEKNSNREGMFLAWAGIVDVTIMAWNDFRPLTHWIAWMEEQLARNPKFPSPEVEERVIFGMFSSLMYHQPNHPNMAIWAQRTADLISSLPSDNSRIAMANQYILHLTWSGDFDKACLMVERLQAIAESESIQPLQRISWQHVRSMVHWLMAEFEAADRSVLMALELAKKTGIHVFDYYLNMHRAYLLFEIGTEAEQAHHMETLQHAAAAFQGTARQAHYHYVMALYIQLRNNPERAFSHLRQSHQLLDSVGSMFLDALVSCALVQVLTSIERFSEAEKHLQHAQNIAQSTRSDYLHFMVTLLESGLAFAQERKSDAIAALRQAFQKGRESHYFHTDWWVPEIMLGHCQRALQFDIEVAYCTALIRTHNLQPTSPPLHLDNWPWRVKIHTLGRFGIQVDDESISPHAQGKKKPMLLLKALIAFGGRNVAETRISEALWPDAEGDTAHNAFTTTLSRLRKLLGANRLITHEGRLTLNDRLCWLDTWALERALSQLEHTLTTKQQPDTQRVADDMRRVLALYPGDFLVNEEPAGWLLAQRERLRLKVLRSLKQLISHFQKQHACQEVITLYERSLLLDPFEEASYCGLMRCHARLGNQAEALAVYERCHQLFQATFGIEPAEQTRQLHAHIQATGPGAHPHHCTGCRHTLNNPV